MLWEEWKYRHDLFWRSLFRWAGAVVTLWIIPFARWDVIKLWPKIALIGFPSVAFILSVFSAWLLGAEQRRFAMVNTKYDEMRQNFAPPRMPRRTKVDRLFARPIGNSIIWVYLFALCLLSASVFVLLLRISGGVAKS
jgi:hypothetical protein